MRGRRVFLGLAALALVGAAGCSNRLRDNPFDPGNPETGGRPPGFTAIAGEARVLLSWNLVVSDQLAGYEIFRRAPGDTGFVLLNPLVTPDQTSLVDSGLVDDSTYAYRLRFVLTDGSRGTSSDAMARPGPEQIWVADASTGFITRVSPDGRARVFILPGLETPSFVGVEPAQGRVWSTSRDQGIVAVWTANGTLVTVNGTLGAPGRVAPIPSTNDAWICDERVGAVLRFNSGAGVTASATDFNLPSDVAVAGTGAWVADREGRRLVHLTSAATIDFEEAVRDKPWRLAYDFVNQDLWVSYTEAGAVECRNSAGALRFRIEDLARPFTISFDTARGVAWIAEAAGDEVIAFDRSGAKLRTIPVVQPRGVAVNTRTGEVWVTSLGAGEGTGTLQHFAPDGTLLSQLGLFVRPSAVDLDAGP
ncbi:MAG TPA: hypothetical protein VGR66_12615 [Candidatus Eisenbacteria bacterium]|jgi:streptogramin lyase|nr:hypothetical protein [Candidatus Eisenbacteria bacterium]